LVEVAGLMEFGEGIGMYVWRWGALCGTKAEK